MDITKKQFKKLAKEHLIALESYRLDENGNTKLEIYGIDNLYKALTLNDVIN